MTGMIIQKTLCGRTLPIAACIRLIAPCIRVTDAFAGSVGTRVISVLGRLIELSFGIIRFMRRLVDRWPAGNGEPLAPFRADHFGLWLPVSQGCLTDDSQLFAGSG